MAETTQDRPAASSGRSSSRRYLTALDGVRALSAVAVIIIHTESEKNLSIDAYVYTGAVAGPLFLLFFAITGFVLYRGMARRHLALGPARTGRASDQLARIDQAPRTEVKAKGGAMRLLARRFIRIYPLYWAVATAALIVNRSDTNHSFTDYLQVYTLIPFPNPGALADLGLGIVLWTLLIDIVFYIYVAIHGTVVTAILRRTRIDPFRFEVITLVGLALLVPLANAGNPGPFVALSSLPLGMLFAVVDARQDQLRRRLRPVKFVLRYWWIGTIVYVMLVLTLIRSILNDPPAAYGDLLANYLDVQLLLVGAGQLFLTCILWGPRKWTINRWLSSKALIVFGSLTYGTYLWHPVVLSVMARGAANASFLVTLAVALFGSTAVALVTFLLIERPLIRQRSKLHTDDLTTAAPDHLATLARPAPRT